MSNTYKAVNYSTIIKILHNALTLLCYFLVYATQNNIEEVIIILVVKFWNMEVLRINKYIKNSIFFWMT